MRRAAPATTPPIRRAGRTARAPTPPRTPRRARRRSPHARTERRACPAEKLPTRSRGEHRVAHPLLLLEEPAAVREPLLRARAVPGHDVLELVPVRLAVLPHAVVVLA